MSPFDGFSQFLQRPDVRAWIRDGLIGESTMIDGPYGPKPLIYADYVASGRALNQVEDFIRDQVLPFYANSHTQASYCGAMMTRMRDQSRAEVARMTNAGPPAQTGISVVFTGAGSTAGINRIVGLLAIDEILREGGRVVVLVGPYEHHSNLLPWRETGAEVIEIAEADTGGPDMDHLTQVLHSVAGADLCVGAFGAASNVTGIITDTDAVTRLLKRHGALAIWDFGCAGPYLPMDMKPGTDAAKDAIVFSTHKFAGGPGASGVTVLRNAIARRQRPTQTGGGTVSFVSPWGHVYSDSLVHREEAGTPNVIGDIRVALALLIKEALGQDWLIARQETLRQRAMAVWSQNPHIVILGRDKTAPKLPIFSFLIRDVDGAPVHHQFFTRLLSDLYGVQARGGCACAGSYGHRLLDLDKSDSDATFAAIARGQETDKPGWVRLNFSALMSDSKADAVIAAVDSLAREAAQYRQDYHVDTTTARFTAVDSREESIAH